MTANKERVKRAESALMAAYGEEMAVRDLLADLRHYCDAHKLDYGAEDKSAYGHYLAEIGGAR